MRQLKVCKVVESVRTRPDGSQYIHEEFVEETYGWVDPVQEVAPAEAIDSSELEDFARAVASSWITSEEAARAWGVTYETLPDGTIREVFFDQAKDPGAAAAFSGFCDPCGGFRKHKRGCPVVRKPFG